MECKSIYHGLLSHYGNGLCIATSADPLDFHLLGSGPVLGFPVFSFPRIAVVFSFFFHYNVLSVLLCSVWKYVCSWADHFVVVEITDVVLFSKRELSSAWKEQQRSNFSKETTTELFVI